MVDLPPKLSAILGSSAFFITLIVGLLINQENHSLLRPFKYAALGFLGFLVIGWLLGILWEHVNRGKESKDDWRDSSDH